MDIELSHLTHIMSISDPPTINEETRKMIVCAL